jgi:hypothetical protein
MVSGSRRFTFCVQAVFLSQYFLWYSIAYEFHTGKRYMQKL